MPHCVSKASKQKLNWESVWKTKHKSRGDILEFNWPYEKKSNLVRHSLDLQFSVLLFSSLLFSSLLFSSLHFSSLLFSSRLFSSLLFTFSTIFILIDLKQIPYCVSKAYFWDVTIGMTFFRIDCSTADTVGIRRD